MTMHRSFGVHVLPPSLGVGLKDLMFALLVSVLLWSDFFLLFHSSHLQWEYLSCALVCWKYVAFFFIFTEAQSYQFALSLRGD